MAETKRKKLGYPSRVTHPVKGGRPKIGRQIPVRLSEEDQAFARSLSGFREIADGIRCALDESREKRGLPVPQRPEHARRQRSHRKK